MRLHLFKVGKPYMLALILVLLGGWLVPLTPALAQGPGSALLEKPPAAPPEEEKRRALPLRAAP